MKNDIINNGDGNAENTREYKLSCIKKEQNTASFALLLMILIGFAAAVFLPDADELTVGFDGYVKETLGTLYNSFTYLLYAGTPAFVLFIIKRSSPGSRIGFKKSMPHHPLVAGAFCLGVMYFGNVLAGIVTDIVNIAGGMLPDVSNGVVYNGIYSFMLAVVTTAVLPAFIEEIFLRGFVMGGMARYDKRAALLISSLLFGLMHLNPIQAIFAVIAGLVLGHFVLESNSLWFGVAVHFANNFIALIKNTMGMSLSDEMYFVLGGAIDIAIFVLGMMAAVYLVKHKAMISDEKYEGRMLLTFSDGLILYGVIALFLTFMQISF